MGKLQEKSWKTPQDFCHFEKVQTLDGASDPKCQCRQHLSKLKLRNRDASSISVCEIGQGTEYHI